MKRLSSIPGVGKKLAERLGLELKDKVAGIVPASSSAAAESVAALGGLLEDAVGALLNLGYRKPQAEAAVKAASDAVGTGDLPALLSAALRLLSR